MAAPDLAPYSTRRLVGSVACLATIRPDGNPRIHPLVPHYGDGHLFVYVDPSSSICHDLHCDGRYALHCSVEDRRDGDGELGIRDGATPAGHPTMRAFLLGAAREENFEPQERCVVFELTIERVLSKSHQGGEPVR